MTKDQMSWDNSETPETPLRGENQCVTMVDCQAFFERLLDPDLLADKIADRIVAKKKEELISKFWRNDG